MREELLHFIWKYKKLQLTTLSTTNNETIIIEGSGTHNYGAGPDFTNAKVRLNGQLWAGNVEIHLKASDWYVHGHEKDVAYNNVILHVVWEDDTTVYYPDNAVIPTLELKKYISKELLHAYEKLLNNTRQNFINCELEIKQVDTFLIANWLERLYFDRLERKSDLILNQLKASSNNWEMVLFSSLLKNFGLKINGDSFVSLAENLNFMVVKKLPNAFQLESVFYGMMHLLNDETIVDQYYLKLKNEYRYLKTKFQLDSTGVLKPDFFKLRPPNFPTIRLSQLACLYSTQQNLFSKVIEATTIEDLYLIFDAKASDYWQNHFTFGKVSKVSAKKLTKKFVDLLIINTIIPLKFCYAKYQGKSISEDLISIITQIKKEQNSTISNFSTIGLSASNAMDSQAQIELYNSYCTQNNCLQCAVGVSLLNAKV